MPSVGILYEGGYEGGHMGAFGGVWITVGQAVPGSMGEDSGRSPDKVLSILRKRSVETSASVYSNLGMGGQMGGPGQ